MRTGLLTHVFGTACAAILVANSSTVAAQSEGKLKALLLDALEAVASGDCPPSMMSVMLLDACEQHLSAMMQRFEYLGSIQGAKFLGMEGSQFGPAEVYRVNFSHGQMYWMVNTGPDGKLRTFWSPG